MAFGRRDTPSFGRRKTPVGSTANERNDDAAATAPPPAASAAASAGSSVSDKVIELLIKTYKDDRGVHAETALTAIGALAGYAAQEAIWEGVVLPGKLPRDKAFTVVSAKGGQTYYFGDFLNMILSSTDPQQLSIWKLVAGGAVSAGAASADLPKLDAIFANAAGIVGGTGFGVPRLPADHQPHELPRQALLRLWPQVRVLLLEAELRPLHWPLELGLAAQKLIHLLKGMLDPNLAAKIVMEAAIPMSKLDPTTVPEGS
jgi:hypothetical protein